jgi:hypothetical protein
MANKIPWYVTVDWKAVTGIIGTLAIIAVVIFFIILPKIVQYNKLKRYQGETTGTITNISENTEMDQGHEGTRIYVGSYTVNYYYLVNGATYRGSDRVKATPNAARNLKSTAESKPSQLIVRYDESNPSKSTILIK